MAVMHKLADQNIWIGGMFALNQKERFEKANITHILSVLRLSLKEALFDGYQHHLVEVNDDYDEDLLQHFPSTNAFIAQGLNAGGAVFVHCAAGISRSGTVLTAYLMKSRRLSVSDALGIIRAVRPFVQPNESFMRQLNLYEKMGFPDNVPNQPEYQRWLWQQEVSKSNAAGKAPEQIRFVDQEREAAMVQGLAEGSSEEVELELRCKRCRQILATSHTLAPHKGRLGPSYVCAHHFLEPLLWMKPEMSKGAVSGKLECPKCQCKVGSYAWQGIKCSCGNWVVPGISVARGKVDEVKISRP